MNMDNSVNYSQQQLALNQMFKILTPPSVPAKPVLKVPVVIIATMLPALKLAHLKLISLVLSLVYMQMT